MGRLRKGTATFALMVVGTFAQTVPRSIRVDSSGTIGESMFKVIGNGVDAQQEFGRSQAGLSSVDAISGAQVCTYTYSVHQCNGIAAYVKNMSSATNAIGMFGQAFSASNNSASWGGNFLVQDAPGLAGKKLAMQGLEVNVNANSLSYDYIRGISIIGESTTQPAGTIALGIFELGASRHKQWSYGVFLGDNAARIGIQLGTAGAGNNEGSQRIRLYGRDAAGINHVVDSQVDSSGNYLISTTSTGARIKATEGGFNAAYFESNSFNVARIGQIRLGSNDAIAFRNDRGDQDILIGKNHNDQLTVPNGLVIAGGAPLVTSNQMTGAGTNNPNNVVVNSAMPLVGMTAPLGGETLSANTCTQPATIEILGATTSMPVVCSPSGVDIGDGTYWKAWISDMNRASVKVCATISTTPKRARYSCRVIQ